MTVYYKDFPVRLKWYLIHWKYYVTNHEWLSDNEKYIALIFFKALKRLNKDELIFLKEKYYTDVPSKRNPRTGFIESYKPYSDKAMADKMGIETKDYTVQRLQIEAKLTAIIKTIHKEQNKEILEKLDEFTLKLGKLYLKSFEIDSIGAISPDYVFTQDGKRAHVFKAGDPIEKELVRKLKLEREPMKDEYFYYKNYVTLG